MQVWLRKYKDKNTVALCYKVSVFDSIDFTFASPISPMPLPEEGGEKNVLVKMEGNTYTNRFTWIVKDESVNAASANSAVNGIYTQSTKTIFEQLRFFSDETGFVGTGLADDYDMLILEDGSHSGDEFKAYNSTSTTTPITLTTNEIGVRGFVRNLTFSTSSAEPATLRASLELIQGETPLGYQSNTPSVVRNFKVEATSGSTDTSATITYTTPERDGGSSITAYLIYWRTASGNGNWSVEVPSPATATSIIMTSLTASTEYDFKVRALNSNGKGVESYIITHATTS